jgi:hypothetical protein
MFTRKGERPTSSKSPQLSITAAAYLAAGDVDSGHNVREVKLATVMAGPSPSSSEWVSRANKFRSDSTGYLILLYYIPFCTGTCLGRFIVHFVLHFCNFSCAWDPTSGFVWISRCFCAIKTNFGLYRQILLEVLPLRAELTRGQTDRHMTKLVGAYCDYAKAPKIKLKLSCYLRLLGVPCFLFSIITYSEKTKKANEAG